MSRRVSIVTVCYNAATTLERTIQAVLAQTCSDLEYIIIDGGSTDGTVDIIRKYQARIAFWRSERDGGIADAFNKGIACATGAYIGFVNADDWPEPGNADIAVEILEVHPAAAFVYGDLIIHRQGAAVYRYSGSADYRSGFGLSMGRLNHPTLICRREMFDRIGLFDTRYRVAMDFDWLLRLHCAGFYGLYDSRIQGHMETGGASVRLMLRGLAETRDAALAVGRPRWNTWRHFWICYLKARLRLFAEAYLSYGLAQWLRRHLFHSVEALHSKK